ncbi:MAG: hypothetical protein Q3964_03970 [Carnobacterium sp.]|nr:hypothetical protein [Carnobacterium sp.]
MKKKNKFHSLTPEIMENNEDVYTEALDYVFSTDDIRNIAITGIYGAGKSTVWNTYKNHKLNCNEDISTKKMFENVITISIGGYDYYSRIGDNKDQEILKALDWEESRIERLIIKQMLAQIKQDKNPLSKYKFKKNKGNDIIEEEVFLSTLLIVSVLSWIFRDSIASALQNYFGEFNAVLWIMMFSFISFLYGSKNYLLKFFTFNKFKFSTIKFQGAEANFKDEMDDEIGLEKNSKEIVYLLASSNTKLVVFEDLDRFNKNVIYSKLKELNYLLNCYLKTNGEERIVRFVYIIRDGLFYSKDRTKFFDYILPIVPIVDSNTSVNKFIELMKGRVTPPPINLLAKVSLYVDDMRIIRNIVNEYIVYSNVLPMRDLRLKYPKLFCIITLKNIFPNEFQLLQEDRGFIKHTIRELEDYKKNLRKEILKDLRLVRKANSQHQRNWQEEYYRVLDTLISEDVELMITKEKQFSRDKFLMDWSKNNKIYKIKYKGQIKNYNYEEFVKKFILIDKGNIDKINELVDVIKTQFKKMEDEEKEIIKKFGNVNKYKWKDIIKELSQDQRDNLFNNSNFEITKDHYFPLIRYLLVSGLLDESYWYYLTNFTKSKESSLKINDLRFMKGLLEGSNLDLFLDIDSPDKILKRLTSEDYGNPNILNYKLFKWCVEKGFVTPIKNITISVRQNNNYNSFIIILDKLELHLIKKYIDILIDARLTGYLMDILEEWIENNYTNTNNLDNIIEYISDKNHKKYKEVIEKYEMRKNGAENYTNNELN